MPAISASGVVSVSIDTEAASPGSTAAVEAIDSVVIEIFDRFQSQQMPATWVLGDPRRRKLAERIAHAKGEHELALSGYPEHAVEPARCQADVLVTRSKPTIRQQESLPHGAIKRLLECQRMGLNISTVTENSAWQPRDIDLLAKHEITAIRSAGPVGGKRREHARSGPGGLHTVRYGLWYIPVSSVLNGGWIPYFVQLQLIKLAIAQVTREVGVCHIQIDAPSIARGDAAGGLRAVDRLLQHFDQLRATHSISIETLHSTAIRLQPKRTVTGARSILRAA